MSAGHAKFGHSGYEGPAAMLATAIRTVFAQPTADTVFAAGGTVVSTRNEQLPGVNRIHEQPADITAFGPFAQAQRHKMRTGR